MTKAQIVARLKDIIARPLDGPTDALQECWELAGLVEEIRTEERVAALKRRGEKK